MPSRDTRTNARTPVGVPAITDISRSLTMQRDALIVAAALAVLAAAPSLAHDPGSHAPSKAGAAAPAQKAFGIAGDARKISRTIDIRMTDDMRFDPSKISVKAGETIRFVHRNAGKLMHEMVIGTRADLVAHAENMRKHPGMDHDEPWIAHVAPGKRGEIVWHFNRAGEFEFACLIPGHFEAGMRGTISVANARPDGRGG
jgi:uncharacterized cupredoxin-like copper-binding protein